MTDLEIIKASRELIADKSRWCQGYYAFTFDGIQVHGYRPVAVRWCSVGAIQRFAKDYDLEQKELHVGRIRNRIERLMPALGYLGENLAVFNDAHTHEEVIQMWDHVINYLEQQ